MDSSSQNRTVCMHLSYQNSVQAEPDLTLYGTSIPVVAETNFLGLIFDRKLASTAHIKYLRDRWLKAPNQLCVVAHKDWGAGCATTQAVSDTCEVEAGILAVWYTDLHDRRFWRALIGCKMQHYIRALEPVVPRQYQVYT